MMRNSRNCNVNRYQHVENRSFKLVNTLPTLCFQSVEIPQQVFDKNMSEIKLLTTMAGQTRLKNASRCKQLKKSLWYVFEYFCNFLIKGRHKKRCQILEILFVVCLKYRNILCTLAISKLLCKENAGAILKPLLTSNE